MNSKHKLTSEGLQALQEEYKYLTEVARPENIRAIQEARGQGDLSENADYDAARNEQAKIAERIAVIESILKNYEIIGDRSLGEETSNLGKWVRVEFEGFDDDEEKVQCFKIVGTLEADPLKRLVSNESPLGSAIVNRQVGDRVYVKPEEGDEFYAKLLEISNEELN